jgi:hypothetical protein
MPASPPDRDRLRATQFVLDLADRLNQDVERPSEQCPILFQRDPLL